MGSIFELLIVGQDPVTAERLGAEAFDHADRLEQQLSHFVPASELCRINALAFHEPVPVSPLLWSLLLRLRKLSEETEGAFDPTAGKLVRAWGFFRRGLAHGEAPSPPDFDEIAILTKQIGWRSIILEESCRAIRFLSPAVELHLGAVGKGYIVQAVADLLRAQGVECALVHSGYSSIVAIGAPPDTEGWSLGIAAPTDDTDEEETVAKITIADAALTTSGSAGQTVDIDGKRYGHLFDPRTGLPIPDVGSVSVVTRDATEGDALSTAFAVQGAVWTEAFCRNRPGLEALFVFPATETYCKNEKRWRIMRMGTAGLAYSIY